MKNDFELIKENAEKSELPYSEYLAQACKLLGQGMSVQEVVSLLAEKND